VDLPGFCRFLDGEGAHAVFCLMVDMYSDRPLAQTVLAPGGSLLETCPFFDREPYRLFRHEVFPHAMAFGGPRARLFNERLSGERRPPQISKVPLVRWRADTRYLASTHHMTPTPLAQITGALLHFKFLSDFAVRAEVEQMIRQSGLNATILRPWYVLGPGRRWPLLLKPMYWLMEQIPATRESAQRLGLVTREQMVGALVRSVENPAQGIRILGVPEIRGKSRS